MEIDGFFMLEMSKDPTIAVASATNRIHFLILPFVE